jgi:hypothetical protein
VVVVVVVVVVPFCSGSCCSSLFSRVLLAVAAGGRRNSNDKDSILHPQKPFVVPHFQFPCNKIVKALLDERHVETTSPNGLL